MSAQRRARAPPRGGELHLLGLAMLQHPGRRWAWGQFVLVYRAVSPALAAGVADYVALLGGSPTFAGRTLDSLIDHPDVLPTELASGRHDRYLW